MNMQVEAPNEQEQEQEYKSQIAEMGKRDLLTGLYNRQFFLRLLRAQGKQSREGLTEGLLYIRPDDFGALDERMGPVASDTVLKSLAEILNRVTGRNAVAARFGGTIFTVFVVRASFAEVERLALEIRDAVASNIFQAGRQSTSLTVSIGLADLTHIDEGMESIVCLAQKAAQQAREEGSNKISINRSLEEDEEGRLLDRGWFKKIKAALESNNFQLVYQPIASLAGESCNIFDVLVRMLDDAGEEIMPSDFMPAAERTGLMCEIDRWVIDYAFRVAAQRKKEKKESLFFLRVSEASLLDEGFEEWIARRYRTRKVPDGTIIFQLEERVAEQHLVASRSLAALTRKLNGGIALGHYGSSDKSLQLLSIIGVNYVITDSVFMEGLKQPENKAKYHSILETAQEKEVAVIASQVENAGDISTLCRLGVNYVQGYYLQEPEDVIVDNILLPE